MLGNGTVDWETVLRTYAKEHGQRLFETAQWLVERPSLRVAVELLGFHSSQAESLGRWLDSRGYTVPPVMSEGDYATVGSTKKDVPEPKADKVIARLEVTSKKGNRVKTSPMPNKDERYITVRIPLEYTKFPESSEILNASDRDGLIRNGVIFLQNAAAWATKDIIDIMGDVEVTPIVQKFIDRKMNELFPKEGNDEKLPQRS